MNGNKDDNGDGESAKTNEEGSPDLEEGVDGTSDGEDNVSSPDEPPRKDPSLEHNGRAGSSEKKNLGENPGKNLKDGKHLKSEAGDVEIPQETLPINPTDKKKDMLRLAPPGPMEKPDEAGTSTTRLGQSPETFKTKHEQEGANEVNNLEDEPQGQPNQLHDNEITREGETTQNNHTEVMPVEASTGPNESNASGDNVSLRPPLRPGAVAVSGIGFNSRRFEIAQSTQNESAPDDVSTVMVDSAFVVPDAPDEEEIRARIETEFLEQQEQNEREPDIVIEGVTEAPSNRRNRQIAGAVRVGIVFLIIIAATVSSVLVSRSHKQIPLPETESPATSPPTTSLPTATPTRFEALISLLAGEITTNIEVFEDNSTAQFKALDWLANEDPLILPIDTTMKRTLKERYAIMVLYFENGQDAMLHLDLNFTSASSVCDWHGDVSPNGIRCNNETWVSDIKLFSASLSGRVTSEIGLLEDLETVDLGSNSLDGSLPTELGSLSRLERIDFFSCPLTGTIPTEFGKLRSLKDLTAGFNFLTGSLPTELGQLTDLTILQLAFNVITGTIPTELGLLTRLEFLHLIFNELTGTIPAEFGNLSAILFLEMHLNSLTGTIPSELGLLTTLFALWLNSNEITGSIPAELSLLTNLGILYLNRNKLSSTIPTELARLAEVGSFPLTLSFTDLNLGNNALTGTIPTEFGGFRNLETLNLDGNQLSGPLPTELGLMTETVRLQLFDNALTGSVPTELGNLESLASLLIQNNRLNGSIPSEFGRFSELTAMNLGNNSLTGTIPTELGNLGADDRFILSELLISENRLTGRIPTELGLLVQLEALELGNNELTGSIPTEFARLLELKELTLHGNNLSGSLDPMFCDVASRAKVSADCEEIQCSCCTSCCVDATCS